MQTINPTTEKPLREYAEHTSADIEQKLRQAEAAFSEWRRTPISKRSTAMANAAKVLQANRESYARMMTEEMGKPISESFSEIDKFGWVCEYYAENAANFLAERVLEANSSHSFVRFDPLGPVLAIMPWNFPFWQLFRFAAPSLMAGNVGLLKHAANVCGCALAIENVFREAGFPDGALTTLIVPSDRANELIANPIIRAVTLTGSERAGKAVAETAGKHIKKCVLELGGSDPFIVLADADLEETAKQAARARCINTGQSCIAAKRFIVEQSIADRFEEALVAEMESFRIGDPMDSDTDLGPLARKDLVDSLHDQVTRSVDEGARVLTGGKPLDRTGFYYPPTVLCNVRPGMAAFDEETFGPVAAVIRADDREDAIRLANRSRFGLGASVWTADVNWALDMAVDIEAGGVFINEIVKSDPRLPFGGVKRSGYGRELSEFGIHEFVNIKTVKIA